MREANDKRVNITLSEKLLDQIDRRARRDGLSRSGLVREALEAYLAESSRLQVGQLRDQLEGAWAALGRARVHADWDRAPALDQASALQGVEIEPRDVDLLFRTREDLMAFVRKMHGLTPSSPEAPLSVEDWRSSQAQPIKTETFPGAFTWHKAAWDIEGVRLDATAIENNGVPDSLHGDGVWEGGDHVWSFVTRAQDLPVVALEVQLESCLRRDLDSRARAIAVCLQHSGYAVERLVQVLSRGHLERVRKYLS